MKSNQVGQTPNMIRDPGFHRGRHAKTGMYPAEIVVGKMQAVRSPQVFPFLAEAIRQAREPPHRHTHR